MIEIDDLVNIDNSDYIVLDIIPYGGINYYFVNKVLEDESNTTEFYFMKINDNIMIKESDTEILNILSPLVSNNLQKKINDIKAGD